MTSSVDLGLGGADGSVDRLDADTVTQANISFHNRFADQYEKDVSTFDIFQLGGACQRRLSETLAEAAQHSGGGLLLDVCGGTGNVLRAARPHFDRCLGIDISVNMMAIAAERGLEVLGADATNIPVADASVDCVTAFSALHHVVDFPSVVSEMARVLKPGGIFYSDWDPNEHVTHTGWAVSPAVRTLNNLRRLVTKGDIPETAEQRAAEYHHYSTSGFDPELVAKTLMAADFGKVDVVYHLNPRSFAQARHWTPSLLAMAALKVVSFIPPVPGNLYPWVAVRGVK